MEDNFIFQLLLVSVRILLAVLAVIIVLKCYNSMRKSRRDERPLLMLLNKYSREKIPVLFWENTIGRSNRNDIIIDDPAVSRSHAVLLRRESSWMINDTGSKSGILINGESAAGRTEVYIGDEIRLGKTTLILRRHDDFIDERQPLFLVKPPKKVTSPAKLLFFITLFHLLMAFEACFTAELTDYRPFTPFLAFSSVQWLMFFFSRAICRRPFFEIESLAMFLSGAGVMLICRQDYNQTFVQIGAVALGAFVYLFLVKFIENPDRVTKWRIYIMIAAALFLLINLALGTVRYGAANWIQLGPVRLQPSEFVKIAYIFVGASALDNLQTRKNLLEFVIFSGVCIGSLFIMSDFGTALIFFATFIMISFMRSGDFKTIIFSITGAVLGGFMILNFKPYIAERFESWGKAFEYVQGTGYQPAMVLVYIASGGLFGVGIGNGCLKYIGASETDLVFGIISEEMGFIVAMIFVFSLLGLVFYSRAITTRSRSTFYSISACCASGLLIFQTALNIFGATDILPLTGVTLPFLSMGGSSIVSCFGLIAFIKAADERTYSNKKRRKVEPCPFIEQTEDNDGE